MRRCRNYEILTLEDARNPNKSEQERLKYDKYQPIMFLSRLFDQVHHHVYVHAHVHVLVRLHVNLHVCKHVNAHVHCPCPLYNVLDSVHARVQIHFCVHIHT